MSAHPADLYAETRRRVVDLVGGLDPSLAVPACPGWDVHDVVAHVVGLASDVTTGRVDGYAGAAWTAQQVAERSSATMPELIAEWDSLLDGFLAVNRDLAGSGLPDTINHVLGPVPTASFEAAFHVDLLHHEHDLLGAAGRPRRIALPADVAAMRAQLTNVRLRFAADSMPTLRVAPSDAGRTWDVGSGSPSASVSAPTIELLRSFGGRRTIEEIQSFDWTGEYDGMAERLVLPFFEAPHRPVAGG